MILYLKIDTSIEPPPPRNNSGISENSCFQKPGMNVNRFKKNKNKLRINKYFLIRTKMNIRAAYFKGKQNIIK